MRIKNITFFLENCDWITIDGKYIGDIELKDINKQIQRVATNSIIPVGVCNHFFIEIHKNANRINYAFQQENHKEFEYNVFQRLHDEKDITSIRLILIDENEIEHIFNYYVPYELINYKNLYQTSYISDLGHLYIFIDLEKPISSKLDYNKINNSDYMNMYFKNLLNINYK